MVYVILGETASGKTDTAIRTCRDIGAPLISADAFNVYKGFDIGSAKPFPDELYGVDYYFIDTKEFGEEMTVYEFQKEGRKILEGFLSEGTDVVISGGTFLYVRALLFPYFFPESNEEETQQEPDESLEEMVDELQRLDPAAMDSVDLKNPRRVWRAVQLARSGKLRSEIQAQFVNKPLYPTVFIRIKDDKEAIEERIKLRAKKMMESGLVDETKRLMKQNPEFASKFKGIGFKEIYFRLINDSSLEGVEEEIAQDTIKYAKRQRTFLNHQFPYYIELPREEIPAKITADVRERRMLNMNDSIALTLPLFPALTREYTPYIDKLYRAGIRQIGVYTPDRALIDDFTYWVHVRSPLMQIVYFDSEAFKDRKLPPFSFVVPNLDNEREDPLLTQFILDKGIARTVPAGLEFVAPKRKRGA